MLKQVAGLRLSFAPMTTAGAARLDRFFDREPRRTHLLPFTRESRNDRRALWELCASACARVGGAPG